jgi:hypothetical protein
MVDIPQDFRPYVEKLKPMNQIRNQVSTLLLDNLLFHEHV